MLLSLFLSMSFDASAATPAPALIVAQDDDDDFEFDAGAAGVKAVKAEARPELDGDDELGGDDEDPTDASPRPGGGPGPLNLGITGKAPLADNYPIKVVNKELDAVVIELPVLLAPTRADFKEADFWLIAEISANGKAVSETRQKISASGIAEEGPSFYWVKALVPVGAPEGSVEVKVSRAAADGSAPAVLFTRKGDYKL